MELELPFKTRGQFLSAVFMSNSELGSIEEKSEIQQINRSIDTGEVLKHAVRCCQSFSLLCIKE